MTRESLRDFNRSLSSEQRKKLFRLRHKLTVMLMENIEWENCLSVWGDISEAFSLPRAYPSVDLKEKILVPNVII